MSAQAPVQVPKVSKDLRRLAPKFREAVTRALAECAAAGLDAVVFEALRSQELQAIYYARGRTIIPPPKPVTNAKSVLESWHGYGLAVDVIHRKYGWEPPQGLAWFAKVAEIFKRNACRWGGDWKLVDPPHFQWHRCNPSPSAQDRALFAKEGMQAVWRSVGAEGVAP